MTMMKNLFQRYLSAKVLPIWTILFIDVLIIVVSSLLSYALRYDFKSVFQDSSAFGKTVLAIVVVNLIFFRVFRIYSNVLRFSSFGDIMRIFLSLTLSYALLTVGSLWAENCMGIALGPVSVLLMSYIISFAVMACLRVLVKTLFDALSLDGMHSFNVFIYGAGEVEVNIAKALRVDPHKHYRLCGFIADEPELINKIIMGVKVYPNDNTLIDNLKERNVQIVIIPPAKMGELQKSEIVDRILACNIKLMTALLLSEWNGWDANPTQLKDIQIEDLLQHAPIEVNTGKVASQLQGKCVLITGAAGSIGSELMRQIAQFNPRKLILVDHAETPLHNIRLELQDRWSNIDFVTIVADVSDAARMEDIFREHRPQNVFHAAAYKHVPMMEENESESIRVNVRGTCTVVDLAVKYGVEKFILISTDSAVNPTSVMGCSKRICEIYVQSLAQKLRKEGEKNAQLIITRFGNVLGSNGSVIPRFRDQIRHGGPVTITHPEMTRYFMTIPEACRLVLEAGSMGGGGEIYLFDMGKPVRILDLAERMISLSGRTNVKIEFTGLRQGEKLYEELLNGRESAKPTAHEKIMLATASEYDYVEVKEHIRYLMEVNNTYDKMKIVAVMKDMIPEFVSKNSCFETLDRKSRQA